MGVELGLGLGSELVVITQLIVIPKISMQYVHVEQNCKIKSKEFGKGKIFFPHQELMGWRKVSLYDSWLTSAEKERQIYFE